MGEKNNLVYASVNMCSYIIVNKRNDTKIFLNMSGRFGALKSDPTHHFFRNACTKSGSLRFSQFSGC
jgi:hypothetical protein